MTFIKTQRAKLYSTAQIRELDRLTLQELGIPPYELMVRAGKASWDYIETLYKPKSLIIFAGTGNNGGDGYIIGIQALKNERQVTVYSLGAPKSALAKMAYDAFISQGGKVDEMSLPLLENLNPSKFKADVIIDSILGTGAKGELRPPVRKAVSIINASTIPVLSIDIPTGLDADTGRYLTQDSICVKADNTITFVALKRGFYTCEALDLTGDLHFAKIGVPDKVYDIEPSTVMLLRETDFYPMLPPRLRNTHKGSFGAVTIIGGMGCTAGAPALAANAALRAGVGWIAMLVEPSNHSTCAGFSPDVICGDVDNEQNWQSLIDHADTLVIGPGLGTSDKSAIILFNALSQIADTDKRVILDADALNLLPDLVKAHPQLAQKFQKRWVLTPHPKEAARLLGKTTQDIQNNRFKAATQLYAQYGGVVVLKGAGTLIADSNATFVCPYGNANMAVAGMGDVLSGVIGALLAQVEPQFSLSECAIKGTLIHALAGDLASETYGVGLIASDMNKAIYEIINRKAEYCKKIRNTLTTAQAPNPISDES